MHAGGRSLVRRPAASAESQKTTRQLLRGRRPSALDRQPKSSSCRDPADLVPRSRAEIQVALGSREREAFLVAGLLARSALGRGTELADFRPCERAWPQHGRPGVPPSRLPFQMQSGSMPGRTRAIFPHRLHFRGLLSQALQRQKATLRTLGGSQWGSRTTASSSGRSLKNLRCR